MQQAQPSREEIAAQLERILASDRFTTAGRLGPFLRYVVETTLDGRAAELKESTIGVGAFGRSPDYDPRTDPIVRVEARRLRNRLADYYAGPGATDPVLVDLPKGAYIPVFTLRGCTPESPPIRRPPWRLLAGVLAIVAASAIGFVLLRPSQGRPPASLAVLPFANLSADPANEYFSDGLTDELIDTLSNVPGLKVIGRSLVFQQKGKSYDAQALGRQWNVGAVLEGSVRRSGDRLRITAQLTNTADGYNLWAQTYDREARDVFAIQQEIAENISKALRVRLVARGPRETNVEAYNHYLEGRYQANRFTDDSFKLALKSLEAAIATDPQYVPAYSLLAKVYGLAGYYYVLPPPEAWGKAERLARRALEIDPEDGDAHASVGFVLGLNHWRWAEAEREFRVALELAPASADVHGGYAVAVLMPQGRLEEAVAEYRRSLELDPLAPFANMGAGFSLLALKRYDEALAHYKRGLELISTFTDMWWDTGMCLAMMGRKDEALKYFRKASEIDGDTRPNWEPGAMQNAMLGNKARALEQLRKLDAEASKFQEDFMDLARGYALLGDVPDTVRWLERAWAVRHPQLVWLKVDPRFEKVREAPEIQAMIRRLGL